MSPPRGTCNSGLGRVTVPRPSGREAPCKWKQPSDQSVLLVGYFALHIADRAAALHDSSLRCESSLPYRSKEIDFQLDGGEGFLRRKSACECHSHRGVRNVAQNPAM